MFRRLKRLIWKADRATDVATSAARSAKQAADKASYALDETIDGVNLKIVWVGDHTILDFICGECKELPLVFRIEPLEPEDME